MARYDEGYGYGPGRRPGPRGTDWSRTDGGFSRGRSGRGPGVGGYGGYGGYAGGSRGIPARSARPTSYGRDYWWLGEHELRRSGAPFRYDEAYRRFDAESHPRFSPVGGMYPAMGGRFARGAAPGPLREDTWFSDWTRWF